MRNAGFCPTTVVHGAFVHDPEVAQNSANATGNTNSGRGDYVLGLENLSEQQLLDETLGLLNPSEQRLAERGAVAYELRLPASMGKMHDVSLLKRYKDGCRGSAPPPS